MHQSGLIFVISAPSGTGKTTLVQALLAQDANIKNAITHTTRPKRSGEKDGIHYHFVSKTEFLRLKEQDFFIETAEVYGHYYGTSCTAVTDILAQNKDVVLNIEWQGAQNVRKRFQTQAITIFITPPCLETLRVRMQHRGDAAAEIENRIHSAQTELAHIAEYDYLIINDQFDDALTHLESIIQAERLRIRPNCSQ